MLPAVVAAVALAIAGHPVHVACDADANHPGVTPPVGAFVEGWTVPGSDTVHLASAYCDDLGRGVRSPYFPVAFGTLIHESAHARGVTSEACAEAWADLTYPDWLARFYGVPFFSPLSLSIGATIYAHTLAKPASYHPAATSCEGQP